MLRASFSPAPECVIVVLLESSFSALARHKMIIVIIVVIPYLSLNIIWQYFRFGGLKIIQVDFDFYEPEFRYTTISLVSSLANQPA